MECLISTIFALFFLLGRLDGLPDNVSSTIIVTKNGEGNFTTVQQAIDSIPANNLLWIRILIDHGVYFEKVVIPKEKPYIILEGHPIYLTAIEFGQAGDVVDSPTFKLFADNFVARNIVFKNIYDHLIKSNAEGRKTTWAPAALIAGDKASFYHCSFISLQDTLSDAIGRHYFYNCSVVGAIDFIWNNGQSIYEKCQIKSMSDRIGPHGGYITAQGRNDSNGTTGFVFKDCYVYGTGPAFLGRPWRPYARVLFASTFMENIIPPEGWTSTWHVGSENLSTFSEANCTGPGADMSHRVPWEKKLTDEEVAYLANTASFIDQDGWLAKQPN